MKRFRFSLERVLAVALIRERLATQEFALAVRQLREAEEGLRQAEDRRLAAQRALDELLQGVIDVAGALTAGQYIEAAGLIIEECQRQVAAAAVVAEGKRQALLQAMKSRKTLERLRERRLGEYRAEQLRLEQVDIDEMAQRISERGHSSGDR